MLRPHTLVLTQPEDVTADVLLSKLDEDGVPYLRLDPASFPMSAQLSGWWEGGRFVAALRAATGEDVDLSGVRSVWYRRPGDFRFAEGMSPSTLQFAAAETRQAFSGVLLALDALWINDPAREARAAIKPLQLRVAQEVGLTVPRTLVTNDPEAAREFLTLDPEAYVYKRLSTMLVWNENGELTAFETQRLDETDLEHLDRVALAPCTFQRYVDKAYEIRATVVGDGVFAAKADSQRSDRGRFDWRLDTELPWTRYELPTDVAARLLAVTRRFGLVFGAFDLIRRPDGEYVFLEVNPSGQWAWFEDDVTIPIRDAIVSKLVEGPASADQRAPVERVG
jgi:glutathione synthase/RimK-type ligase-like ATP-grasp enzyme